MAVEGSRADRGALGSSPEWLPNPIAGLTIPDPRITAVLRPELEPEPGPKRVPGARARQWREMLEDGIYPSRAALARGEGASRAAVTQALGPSIE